VGTAASRPTGPPAEPEPPTGVVVRAGQCLWSIAADLLPARSTDEEITRGWHLLHRVNAARIGTDPDLILPGTHLVVPDLSAAPDREETP
jgi:resuscitation-promoting factor RpfA